MRPTFFTSESVTEGHPDKVADRLSDTVLDALIGEDSHARVACGVMVTTDLVVIAGEIGSTADPDVTALARRVVADVGYERRSEGFDAASMRVEVALNRQSPDIAEGVSTSYETRAGSTDPLDVVGAGDQGMVFGFAVDDTPELMPMPIFLAHRLAERLAGVRKDGTVPYLRPDGKTQVMVEYRDGRPVRVASVLISAQHEPAVDIDGQLQPDLWRHVVEPVVGDDMLDGCTFLVNPTGRFEIGGPAADVGLTGRKIIVDTYGGMGRHGGGAFSGKDPTKVDRSAAYAARHAAKNIVSAGLANRCELQVSYAIGRAHPFSIALDTFGSEQVNPERLEKLVQEFFDFRPAAIIERLDLQRPIYAATSAYGHFGRSDGAFTWEWTDVADDLSRAAADL